MYIRGLKLSLGSASSGFVRAAPCRRRHNQPRLARLPVRLPTVIVGTAYHRGNLICLCQKPVSVDGTNF